MSPGQKLVSCISSEEKMSFDGELEARSGQDTVLRISLAGRVESAQKSRREAEERARRERIDAEQRAERQRRDADERAQRQREEEARIAEKQAACDRGGPSVLMPTDDGRTLTQCGGTGLQWTRSDNGRDVTWVQAEAHCRGIGSGWSLPTVTELQSLRDPKFKSSFDGLPCGRYRCQVSSELRLGGPSFWTSELSGESWARTVSFIDGSRGSVDVLGSARTLCVRRR